MVEKVREQVTRIKGRMFSGLFSGKMKDTAMENICLLNSAFAIHLAGITPTPQKGIEAAKDSIHSGKAMQKLEALVRITNS